MQWLLDLDSKEKLGACDKITCIEEHQICYTLSGMEAWGLAMETMGVSHSHVSAADTNNACRQLIQK